jgi:hypothetical protein
MNPEIDRLRPEMLSQEMEPSSPDFWSWVWAFLLDYQWWILAFVFLGGGLFFFWRKNSRQKMQIRKIWIYTLFFLTKRQMMIPLVYSLAQKDKILDAETAQKLLDIRNQCRGKTLKHNPTERLALEKSVSAILFRYFSELELQGAIRSGTKFEKIVRDLEFIDAKLVELQQVYNYQVKQWNGRVLGRFTWWFYYLFGFRRFQFFQTED